MIYQEVIILDIKIIISLPFLNNNDSTHFCFTALSLKFCKKLEIKKLNKSCAKMQHNAK